MLHKNKTYGFTLIEVIVSVSILAILVTMSLRYYDPKPRQREEMRTEMVNLLTFLEKARGYAISNTTVQKGTEEIVPTGGYGVYWDPSIEGKFILFADVNGTDNLGDGQFTTGTTTDNDIVLDTLTITNPNISFSWILSGMSSPSPEPIIIFFYPPNANAKIINVTTPTPQTNYMTATLTAVFPDVLTEEFYFHRISGFFERRQTFPPTTEASPTPSPSAT